MLRVLRDADEDVSRRLGEEVRERVLLRLAPEVLLDRLERLVAVAAKRDDDAGRQEAVDVDLRRHHVVTP